MEFDRLPGEIESTIFRVVQACLANIHPHSGSKLAQINIVSDSAVTIEVRDRGKESRKKILPLFATAALASDFAECASG